MSHIPPHVEAFYPMLVLIYLGTESYVTDSNVYILVPLGHSSASFVEVVSPGVANMQ